MSLMEKGGTQQALNGEVHILNRVFMVHMHANTVFAWEVGGANATSKGEAPAARRGTCWV